MYILFPPFPSKLRGINRGGILTSPFFPTMRALDIVDKLIGDSDNRCLYAQLDITDGTENVQLDLDA